MIDKELMEILACPVCKGDVKEVNDKIVCLECKRRYLIGKEYRLCWRTRPRLKVRSRDENLFDNGNLPTG
jgi:hypothetical protein